MIKYIGKKIIKNKKIDSWIENNYPNEEIYVSNGWIDSHVHFFSKAKYKLDKNKIEKLEGVVATIDAGSSGYENINEAIKESKKYKKIRNYFLINANPFGLVNGNTELLDLKTNNEKHFKALKIKEVLGTKFRLSNQALKGDESSYKNLFNELLNHEKFIMIHIGRSPASVFDELKKLRKTDVITHYSHGKNNDLFDFVVSLGLSKPILDVGFGNESFNLKMAKKFIRKNIEFDTISTDIHNSGFENKSIRMKEILALFLELGYSLEKVINAMTWVPYEKFIKKAFEDYDQTYTIFRIKSKKRKFKDSNGNTITLKNEIEVLNTIYKPFRKGNNNE